jgi:hypothetical protein
MARFFYKASATSGARSMGRPVMGSGQTGVVSFVDAHGDDGFGARRPPVARRQW